MKLSPDEEEDAKLWQDGADLADDLSLIFYERDIHPREAILAMCLVIGGTISGLFEGQARKAKMASVHTLIDYAVKNAPPRCRVKQKSVKSRQA